MKPAFLRTLTGKTLLRLALAGSVLLLAAAALSSYLLYRQAEGDAALRLSAAAAERARVAERVLNHTVETHEIVRLAFVEKWPSYQDAATAKRFESILALYPDGAWRNRQEIADGRIYPTGWIPKKTKLTDELRCLMVLFWDLSRHYGPGAAIRHDNLFFMGVPEESNLGYDPYLFPNWVFDIPESFSQLDYEWGRLAYRAARPGDRSRYALPEVDDVGPGPQLGPIFQVLTPIHLGERHVATVATTMLLREFLERALPNALSGQRYLLFHANGRWLADTQQENRTAPAVAKATLQQLGGDLPATLQAASRAATDAPRTGYSARSDVYYAVARIDGPEWYIASVLPGVTVRAGAVRIALWGSLACVGVLLVLLALLAFILRRHVAAPLGQLTQAAESVAAGDMTVRLPSGRDDELGRLALAFNDMATKVAERDAALRQDKQDIEAALTSLLKAEQELARQREALHQSEKLAALGGLLAGVAHELNNPLAVVVGRAIQLESNAVTPADRDTATKIRNAAERCARIVKTFLAMARRQETPRAPTSVNEIVRDALDVLAYTLQSGGVAVETELASDLPPVLADASQLGQVFMNLFTNAQQAMARSAGPRRLSIRSRSTADGAGVEVHVRDTGPGVPPELASRIFEPFFTTKAVGEGTGVGLSVSLGIAQSHGGALRLEPPADVGGGACFVVTLPAWRGDAVATAAAAGPARATAAARILIVDDEVEIAEILRDILAPAGHRITLAANGAQALEKLDERAFDLVLTDLKMPGIDGPALYREIQRRHPHLARRVIAITGDTLGTGAREFVESTQVPVIDKPFAPAEVLARVNGALRKTS
ncbi:MAG TPA: ATP-binding protein [Burkholderiaceae bacterium]|nr:ATP-binding protein [Burkholderiaceae bacterium]